MILSNFFSKLFTKKNKANIKNTLPTVRCDVEKYLTEDDILGVLSVIKKKYKDMQFDDRIMVESIMKGYDLHIASCSLIDLNKALSKSEARCPIYWFSSYCHYLHDSRKALSIGITEGEWVSCGCCGPKEKPVNHEKFNGKKFSLKDGLLYRSKIYFPGTEQHCRCMYKPILPF